MSAIPRNSLDTSISPTAANSATTLKAGALSIVKRMASVWQFWAYRRSMTQIVALDDHMLKDIGITRGDVNLAATMPYADDPTAHLRVLAMERRASDLVWTKNAEERRKFRAQRPKASGCEPYRSTDQRDTEIL